MHPYQMTIWCCVIITDVDVCLNQRECKIELWLKSLLPSAYENDGCYVIDTALFIMRSVDIGPKIIHKYSPDIDGSNLISNSEISLFETIVKKKI